MPSEKCIKKFNEDYQATYKLNIHIYTHVIGYYILIMVDWKHCDVEDVRCENQSVIYLLQNLMYISYIILYRVYYLIYESNRYNRVFFHPC